MQNKLTVLSFNIDTNLARLEDGPFMKSHEAWKIENRLNDIFSFIHFHNPSIVLLQEGRRCSNHYGETIDSVTPLVKFLEQNEYNVIAKSYNPSEKAFVYITGIKKEFTILSHCSYYLTETPHKSRTPEQLEEYEKASKEDFLEIKRKWIGINGGEEFEKSVLACLLHNKDGKQFVVINAHLGINEKHRIDSCKKLNRLAEVYKSPIIIAGDFNSFPDREGPEQMSQFTNFKDATNDMSITTDYRKSEETIPGKDFTFISFPYDFAQHSSELWIQEMMKNIFDLDRTTDSQKILEIQKEIFEKLAPGENSKFSSDKYPMGGHLDHVMYYGLTKVTCSLVLAWCKDIPSVEIDPKSFHKLIGSTPKPVFASDHQPVLTAFSI